MRYKPPKINKKPQFVPFVVKNKDWLVGYVSGIKMIENLIVDTLKDNGIEIDLRGIDLCLDSSRFNDIMENGKRESNCSEEEIRKYYKEIIENKLCSIQDSHPDNTEEIFCGNFLKVECTCGLGIYFFKESIDVPDEQFRCQNCGRVIIDYSGHDDEEYDYDGNLKTRMDIINDELSKNNGDEDIEEDEEE